VSQARQSGNRRLLPRAFSALILAHTHALLPASPAAADRSRPPSSAAFSVRGSNGFSVDVESQGGRVMVVASEHLPPVATFSQHGRPRPADTSNGASSIYYARASGADPTRVDARLGRLGRIDVGFHPSGAVRVTRLATPGGAGPCARAARLVRRLGTFTGTVEFQGEDGYTSVRAASARGSVGTPLPSGCMAGPAASARARAARAAPGPRPPRRQSAELRAVNRRDGTSFKATTTNTGVAFLAVLRERRGGLLVARRAYAGAPLSAFAFAADFSWAQVRPPAPFSGAAHFVAGAGNRTGTWEGGLTATFPGVVVPLAGHGFSAELGARR
jgi:hypothetical protein